jgi:uncharacterized protein (TIGR02145 family)
MRKHILTTAAVAAAIGSAGCGSGTFTDSRDGQTYKTVKIGKQTWMAQNLNYQTQRGSWCYDNNADNCKKYGRLYDWEIAKTVCPKGWRLPSREDWDYLGQAVGGEKSPVDIGNTDWYGAGKKLKSKSGWYKNGNGTDDNGFSALPGGYRYSNGDFSSAGDRGNWWTAKEGSDGSAYRRSMYYYGDYVYEYDDYKSIAYSVRCVAGKP